MSFEAALVARLRAASAVTNIVGDNVEWDERAPDAPLPAIVLQTIVDERPQNHDGFDPFWATRVQVNALARTKMEAVALRETAIAALVPAGEANGITFLRTFVDGGGSDADAVSTGRICRERADLIIWHN